MVNNYLIITVINSNSKNKFIRIHKDSIRGASCPEKVSFQMVFEGLQIGLEKVHSIIPDSRVILILIIIKK